MNTRTQKKIISPEEESVIDSSSRRQVTVAAREARALPKTIVVMKPGAASGDSRRETRLLRMGLSSARFSSLEMTFEQFLTVVATVHPSGLSPEYDPPPTSDTTTSLKNARRRHRR